MESGTLYELLGVSEDADAATIRSAYRSEMREHHPDSDRASDDGARARSLNAAYAILSNRVERQRYDKALAEARSAPMPRAVEPAFEPSPANTAMRISAAPFSLIWLLLLVAFLVMPFVWGIWYYGYR